MNFNLFTKGQKLNFEWINFVFIIFIIGISLLLLAQSVSESDNAKEKMDLITPTVYSQNNNQTYEEKIEEKLEEKFTKIQGVGKVEVIIILKTGGEIILNKDTPYTKSETDERDSEGGTRISKESEENEETVLINSADGSTNPIIIKEYLPQVQGVLIIAEGGDNIIVKNNLINAAKVLLGLPTHKIEVMKMVEN